MIGKLFGFKKKRHTNLIVKEISDARLSFFIINDVFEEIDGVSLFKKLRNIDFKQTKDRVSFTEISGFENNRKRQGFSGYIGKVNNCLILNEFIGIHSESYLNKLTEIFPNKQITKVVTVQMDGNNTVTGGILQSYKNGKLTVHVRNLGEGNNEELFDLDNTYISNDLQNNAKEFPKSFYFEVINKMLEAILSKKSILDIKLDRFEWIRFNDFYNNDPLSTVIKNNLPELTDIKISSAWVGGKLRAMEGEANKFILFPNTKEVKELIANIINDLLDAHYKFIKSKWTFMRNSDLFEDKILVGGSDRTGFNISFIRRFLIIEKILNKMTFIVEGEKINSTIQVGFSLENEMESKMVLGGSWHNFATQMYFYLRHGFQFCIPMLNKMEDIKSLNEYVNNLEKPYNCFTGNRNHKLWKRPLLSNCIVAALANAPNKDEIFEDKFLSIFENEELKNKYLIELDKISVSSEY